MPNFGTLESKVKELKDNSLVKQPSSTEAMPVLKPGSHIGSRTGARGPFGCVGIWLFWLFEHI